MTDGMSGSSEGDGSSTSIGAADTGDGEPEWFTIQYTVNKDVDLLFVIDDSAAMAPFQATLAANFPAFIDVLEDPEVLASYRIGITTTNVGNPACTGTAERGAFIASSCRERLPDFVTAEVDAQETGCLDYCQFDSLHPLPTTTALDEVPRARPWLENIDGNDNAGTATTIEAAQCWLPQGIAGCDLVSPLEAGYLALERARTPGDPAHGFLRETASLFVVYLTNGSDCSASPVGEAIFAEPSAFWTDPSAATQGACWSAGVACSSPSPGPDGTTLYGACEPADRGLDGTTAGPDDAVLFPIQRYIDQFDELRAERLPLGADVFAVAIAGFEISDDPQLEFATSPDVELQREHGIAPNCSVGDGLGIPPVRVAAVVEASAIEPRNASICTDDYSPVLGNIADFIRDQIKPACVPRCVADTIPSTTPLDPGCVLRQHVPTEDGEVVEEVPQCTSVQALPSGADVCWVPLLEPSDYCTNQGWNLEARLVRREGHPAPGGTSVEITCEWSEQPAIDCPGS